MAEIIYMNGTRALDFTTRDEFVNGKTKQFTTDEAHYNNERGYRFPWGNLSEKRTIEESKVIYFGIRWSNSLKVVCHKAGMTKHAIFDATMMYLPSQGKSVDVWADDVELEEYGSIIIDLDGEDGLPEKKLREDVWETYVKKMEVISKDVFDISGDLRIDSTSLVRKMTDFEEDEQ